MVRSPDFQRLVTISITNPDNQNVPSRRHIKKIRMQKKFVIPFVLMGLLFCTRAHSQKTDSVKSAKQIILKNDGEKDLPQQLKQNQLNEKPAALKPDTTSIPTKRGKNKGCKKKHGYQ